MAVITAVDPHVECDVPAGESRVWGAAARAHAILTQSLPDECLDDLAPDGTDGPSFRLPLFVAAG